MATQFRPLCFFTDLSAQIVYTAIVGFVMVAAFLEWFLWVAAFLYCLWKVFQKAEHWTVKLLAIFVGATFFLLRYVSLRLCPSCARAFVRASACRCMCVCVCGCVCTHACV